MFVYTTKEQSGTIEFRSDSTYSIDIDKGRPPHVEGTYSIQNRGNMYGTILSLIPKGAKHGGAFYSFEFVNNIQVKAMTSTTICRSARFVMDRIGVAAHEEVRFGMSELEVIQIMGEPKSKGILREKLIYQYDTILVTIVDGKVVDVTKK